MGVLFCSWKNGDGIQNSIKRGGKSEKVEISKSLKKLKRVEEIEKS